MLLYVSVTAEDLETLVPLKTAIIRAWNSMLYPERKLPNGALLYDQHKGVIVYGSPVTKLGTVYYQKVSDWTRREAQSHRVFDFYLGIPSHALRRRYTRMGTGDAATRTLLDAPDFRGYHTPVDRAEDTAERRN